MRVILIDFESVCRAQQLGHLRICRVTNVRPELPEYRVPAELEALSVFGAEFCLRIFSISL